MQYTKSEKGQQAFKQRSPLFSARQRACFILFDGVKTAEQVLAATAGLGATWADVQHLLDHGLVLAVKSLRAVPPAIAPDNAPPFEASRSPARSAQTRYTRAKPPAT